MLKAIIATDQALQWNQTRSNVNAIIAAGRTTFYASWHCSHKLGKLNMSLSRDISPGIYKLI